MRKRKRKRRKRRKRKLKVPKIPKRAAPPIGLRGVATSAFSRLGRVKTSRRSAFFAKSFEEKQRERERPMPKAYEKAFAERHKKIEEKHRRKREALEKVVIHPNNKR